MLLKVKEYYILKMEIKDMKEIIKIIYPKGMVYYIMKMKKKIMMEIIKMVILKEKE